MASVLHGSARTTPRLRAELQASQESTRTLAARYGLNPKTVAKWRKRTTTADAPMGPKAPRSTVLTPAEEAIVVAFRQKTLLPLDDVLGCLRDSIPNLSRSALHRCLQRHGISRLPVEEATEKRKRFKTYEIGYVHIDSCELRHADGRLVMFLAIDRVSKFTYVEFHECAGKMEGAAFLEAVVEVFPYQIHTVLEMLVRQIMSISGEIAVLDQQLIAWHTESEEASRRLTAIPGLGVITATAIAATVTDPDQFRSGRQFAAWLGLTPQQHSTGGRTRLGGISKQGDRYLRRLLVVGATAVMRHIKDKPTPMADWIRKLSEKKPFRLVSVALANKLARIAWVVLTRKEAYRPHQLAA